ncbi:uncharacterized protein [Tursiops truncatus]|uniref:Uncharacterized protein LOC101334165 isoform X1 n=2 Tax=Tursiops truncatus TaxID=9739 RepID=A0A2U3ZZF2_TURTR|nr:uncharacterized protein LOC101334165 isoform X1 [Tursiops truncatus]XP_019774087.2 uncharacterized protein LOC101334165 isoform X1 [Tursiops truncatus]XP_019774095.2 uncharacterized protein LOC101334165 isoform X1 [Tursiops truncatus]XP_019774103.2 uncharacterized protein LOC101334165 isoform X1 [Tursiops truncatus]XP_019774111.2 uncharacterized protein LOC101334165 isoform X1 [Tursiops truncatus]XP_019774118.2 uncharacterized protein LOC101334165 isoform X1 [Tursiops truncatus]XP_01977412
MPLSSARRNIPLMRRMNLPSQPTRPLMVLLGSHHRGHPKGQMDLALTPETHPRLEEAISPITQAPLRAELAELTPATPEISGTPCPSCPSTPVPAAVRCPCQPQELSAIRHGPGMLCPVVPGAPATRQDTQRKQGMASVAMIGGAVAVGAVPVVLGAMGFTGAGIAASSLAAKMMSAAAIANGGGVAAGSLVATLQSVGAAGLSMSSNIILGSAGSALGAWLWGRKKKAPSSPPPGSSTEAERGSRAGDDPPGPQDVSPPNDKSSAS